MIQSAASNLLYARARREPTLHLSCRARASKVTPFLMNNSIEFVLARVSSSSFYLSPAAFKPLILLLNRSLRCAERTLWAEHTWVLLQFKMHLTEIYLFQQNWKSKTSHYTNVFIYLYQFIENHNCFKYICTCSCSKYIINQRTFDFLDFSFSVDGISKDNTTGWVVDGVW